MALSGAIGAVKVNASVGGLDVSSAIDELTIHESIYDSSGPVCEVRFVDPTDALSQNKIGSGRQKINIDLSDEFGTRSKFDFDLWEGANLNDEAQYKQGGLHTKVMSCKGVSPEFVNAQGNYVEKSWEDKTTKIAEDVLKNNYKTEKPIQCDDQAKEKRRWVASNEHPFDVMQQLNDEHVASQSQSSAYCVFQQQNNGQQSYKITTFEKLFQQQPTKTFTQATNWDTSSSTLDKRNSILWMNVEQNFSKSAEHTEVSSEQTINMTTHGVVDTDTKQTKFVLPGKEVDSTTNPKHKKVPQRAVYSKVNEPNEQRITPADAKVKRAQFMRDLAQNASTLEVPYSGISPGMMINLQIPNKTDATLGSGTEQQFAGPVLVVEATTRVKPLGKNSEDGKSSIRATQILKVVKASFVA